MSHKKQGESGMGNPLRTQYTIRRQAKQIKNTRYRKLK
jgi:hypothetical protein